MGIDAGGDWIADFSEQATSLALLPKIVRFLGKTPTQTDQLSNGMYEFEVVTGNAAYGEGERFYLTPAQAHRVYRLARHAWSRTLSEPLNPHKR